MTYCIEQGTLLNILQKTTCEKNLKERECVCVYIYRGFPGGASDKETACQCRRLKKHGFDPWARKIPWRRAWQPTPAFLPGKSHAQEESGGLQSIGSQRVGLD